MIDLKYLNNIGTRKGDIHLIIFDKLVMNLIFNSASELLCDVDEDDEPIAIRRLDWLPPQTSTGGPGCLFALLTNIKNVTLKSIIIGLSPIGRGGKLTFYSSTNI